MLKTTAPIVKTPAQRELDILGAKYDNDLPRLLRPWLSFRIFFKFRKPFIQTEGPHKGKRNDTVHRYGFENNCTYSQCVNGHVEEILLDKKKGFDMCVLLAEYTFRDQFNLAQIYTRSVCPDGKFDILLRQYNSKGEIVTAGKDLEGKEEVIKECTHPQYNKTLFFFINTKGFIELSETPVPSTQEFRDMVTQSLNT
jgi:hypothetical protein